MPRLTLRQQVAALPDFARRKQQFKDDILDPVLMIKDLADQSPEAQDVHLFDDLVFQGSNQLPRILELSREIAATRGDLTFDQVQHAIVDFIGRNPRFYTHYERTVISQDEIILYAIAALGNIERDMAGVREIQTQAHLVRELYSRALTLALAMHADPTLTQPNYGMQRILDALTENYLTEGGCIQGRVNRVFIAYSGMLAALGF
jgi:hypothetical protein